MNPFPALRHVDVAPMEHNGQTLLCVSDPLGYVEDPMLLSPAAFYVAASLDGAAGVEEIRRAFLAQFGTGVAARQVIEVAEALDTAGFLLSPRFEAIRAEATQAFRDAPVRSATLAGKSYPADPEELRAFLDAFFTADGEEGPPAVGGPDRAPLRCLIVPHIDFARGGHVYARGYRALFGAGKPDTVFLFGVAHCGVPVPFTLTSKAFETPLGTLETDQAVVDALAAACDYDPFEHEFVHRSEHSIEFQAILLAYLYGPSVKIVPVLCSSFAENDGPTIPSEMDGINRFLEACRTAASARGRRVAVIAGADLAHVGRRFGDDFDVDDAVIESVARRDEEDLAHVLANAPDVFYASVMKDDNARRVCGLGCIYAALRTAHATGSRAKLHAYDYAHDPLGGIVSFAAIAFP